MAPELLSRQNLFMITCPRTASSLFMRILSLPEQPNTLSDENCGYFFLPAVACMRKSRLMERPYSEWTETERAELLDTYQTCFNNLHDHIEGARAAGKKVVVKEHCPFMIDPTALMNFGSRPEELSITDKPWKVQLPAQWNQAAPFDLTDLSFSNKTILPDTFLISWLPTFLIRHPMVVFRSYYRLFYSRRNGNAEEMQEVQGQLSRCMTLTWTRHLYDWYMSIWVRLGPENCQQSPIILDADDVLTSPELMQKYCQLVGLDESKLQFSWEPLSPDDVSKHEPGRQRMRKTLFASSEIRTDKVAANLDLETEVVKWKKEFGEEQGLYLQGLVAAAMPDYEYLRNKRLSL
jgi:hypothetical protein